MAAKIEQMSPCCKEPVQEVRDSSDFWSVVINDDGEPVPDECLGSTEDSDHAMFQCSECHNELVFNKVTGTWREYEAEDEDIDGRSNDDVF